jgi:hypothetical protein
MTLPQKTLFDTIPHSRNSDPQSSYEAVEKLHRSGFHAEQCGKVMAALEQTLAVGYLQRITALELAAATGLDRYMLSRRLSDLFHAGKIKSEERNDAGLVVRARKLCSVCGEMTLAFWIER